MTRRAKVDEAVRAALAPALHGGEAIRGTFIGTSRFWLSVLLPPLCAWGFWLSVQGRTLEACLLTAALVGGTYLCSRTYLFAMTDRRAFLLASGRGLRKRVELGYELTEGPDDLAFRKRFGRTFVGVQLDGREVTVELGPRETRRARAALAALGPPAASPSVGALAGDAPS